MPAVFVVGTAVWNMTSESPIIASAEVTAATLGGPAFTGITSDAIDEGFVAMVGASDAINQPDDEEPGVFIIDDATVFNTGNPERGALIGRDGTVIYKVQKGETLSAIAAKFGISLNTIYWANKGVEQKALRIGQEITILPISGIFHEVQPDETLASIAARYDVSEMRLFKYNTRIKGRELAAGEQIIIPDAKPIPGVAASRKALPDFPGYYTLPTTGWNWGKLHNRNAVDVANSCGTPIYASAEGLVTAVASPENWNEGYGGYVVIEHPNSTKTKYAHTNRNVVAVGDYVLQGDTVAYIGNTGLTHGPTGCHLHFEVMGARNPFAK